MGAWDRFRDWVLGAGADAPPVTYIPDSSDLSPPASLPLPPEEKTLADKPAHRPVIGVSGSRAESASVQAMIAQLSATGAEVQFISEPGERISRSGSASQAAKKDLAKLDALVVMGNDGDIDPAKYGAAKDPHTNIETDLGRAAYEEAAISQALDSGLPLLGVCAGMQRINVLGGGTLHQHVPDIVGDNHHKQSENHIAPFVPVQIVRVADGSRLAALDGKDFYIPQHKDLAPGLVMENSFHHQAINKIREDFQVNALSDDGIIEGIEPKAGSRYANQFVMGIQWHPEFAVSGLDPKITAGVTEAAKAYSARKGQQADTSADLPSSAPPVAQSAWARRILAEQQNAVMMR